MSRFRRSTPPRSPGDIGFEAAVGIAAQERPSRREAEPSRSLDLTCEHCGSTGRIDMVDTAGRRAYLTCPRCQRTWDTDRSVIDLVAPSSSRSE